MQSPQDHIENGTTLQKWVQKKQLQKAGGAGTRRAPHAVEQEGFQGKWAGELPPSSSCSPGTLG